MDKKLLENLISLMNSDKFNCLFESNDVKTLTKADKMRRICIASQIALMEDCKTEIREILEDCKDKHLKLPNFSCDTFDDTIWIKAVSINTDGEIIVTTDEYNYVNINDLKPGNAYTILSMMRDKIKKR